MGQIKNLNLMADEVLKLYEYSVEHEMHNVNVYNTSLGNIYKTASLYMSFFKNTYNFIPSGQVDERFYDAIFQVVKIRQGQCRWRVLDFVYLKKKPSNSLSDECYTCPMREKGCGKDYIQILAGGDYRNVPVLCGWIRNNYNELIEYARKSFFIFREYFQNVNLRKTVLDVYNIYDIYQDYFLVVSPSYFCNVDCDYCYMGDLIKEKKKNTSDEVVNYIEKFGQFINVVFHGGEPTLLGVEYYKDIIKKLPTANYSIQSNLLVKDIEKWAEFIKRYLGGNVSTSYVDKYRKGGDLFWENVNYLKENGIKPFIIVVYNKDMEPNHLYSQLRDFPFRVNPPFITDKVMENNIQGIGEGYGDFMIHLTELWINDKDNKNTVNPIKEITFGILNNSQTKCPFITDCHKKTFTIGLDGDVFLGCGYDYKDTVKIGNLNSNSLLDLVNSNPYKTANKRKLNIYTNQDCSKCEYLYVCQGGCPLYSYYKDGDITLKFHYCEEFKKIYKYLHNEDIKEKILEKIDDSVFQTYLPV